MLLAFFVPSVALSRVGRARKKKLVDIGKGGARDAWQVLANGGVATACAVVAGWPRARNGGAPDGGAQRGFAWIAGFAGSYAAATADTWGTEIGTLAGGAPRSILTLRPIPTGLSGGVTATGTAAEIVGAAWIACAAALSLALRDSRPGSGWTFAPNKALIVPVVVGGIAGSLVDSVLGATLQELRRCPACARTCETNPHVCGTPTTLVRGIRGFSNDLVNFAATLTGATAAFLLAAR